MCNDLCFLNLIFATKAGSALDLSTSTPICTIPTNVCSVVNCPCNLSICEIVCANLPFVKLQLAFILSPKLYFFLSLSLGLELRFEALIHSTQRVTSIVLNGAAIPSCKNILKFSLHPSFISSSFYVS